MEFASITDIGLVREENQDYRGHLRTVGGHLFVVCDGVGGLPNGALASKTAVESILNDFSGAIGKPEDLLKRTLKSAHDAVINAAANPRGTTVVVVYLDDGVVYTSWCGDSRIYHFRDNQIQWMSRDHNVLHDILNQGKPGGRMLLYPQAITRYLGREDYTPGEQFQFNVEPGDHIMLCSDGLHGFIPEPDIILAITENFPLEAGEMLKAKLLSQDVGAPDNFTWYIIKI